MRPALFTVEMPEKEPSLEEAAAKLSLPLEKLNPEFGVVGIDPSRGLYCVEALLDDSGEGDEFKPRPGGPWSSPPISPF